MSTTTSTERLDRVHDATTVVVNVAQVDEPVDIAVTRMQLGMADAQ